MMPRKSRSIFVIVALGLCQLTVQARVNEDVKQCEARFGKPIRELTPIAPCEEVRVYTKGGIILVLGFMHGISQYAFYSKGDESGFTDFELNTLLVAESEGSEWRKVDTGLANTKWERKDGGAWALYNPVAKSFTVTTKQWMTANQALTIERQSKALDGF